MQEGKILHDLGSGYNATIMQLANEINQSRNLILADYSADNIGRTCGDHVELDLVVHDDKIYIGLEVQGCIHAKASGGWMVQTLNGKKFDLVFEKVAQFKKEIQASNSLMQEMTNPWSGLTLDSHKINCILAPWEALSGALMRFSTATCKVNPNDENALSCDACVVTNQIQWLSTTPHSSGIATQIAEKRVKHNLLAIIRELVQKTNITRSGKFEDTYLEFQRFGKILLDEDDVERLKKFLQTASSKEIDHLRRLRFTGILEYHCRTRSLDFSNSELSFFFTRAIVKATMQETVIKKINAIIEKEQISAVFIKGSKTRELYPERFMRYSNDLDLLTADFDHALKLCSALIHYENFYLPLKHGVAFSIKYVLDGDGKIKLIGHYHLEKYMGKHRLNIDISFPGLPLGLLNITHYPEVADNTISYEDQFIITLTHLFKHEVPYIKDIDDVYLMLVQGKISQARLQGLIDQYNLGFLAHLVFQYLKQIDHNLDNNQLIALTEANLTLVDKLFAQKIIKTGWPYKLGGHFLAQAYDLYQRRAKTHGFSKSIRDLEKIMLFKEYPTDVEFISECPANDRYTEQITALDVPLYTRLFLIPLVLFIDYFQITEHIQDKLRKNDFKNLRFENSSLIIKFTYFTLLLTPVGIFLTTRDWSCEEKRDNIEEKVWEIIRVIGYAREKVRVVRTVNTQ